MELTHSFTVPVGVPETWAAFEDIASVAECFPGAAVTSVEGDTFEGTCKVKLGPIALQYGGAGSFLERDESARRLVFQAQGKDKRGNGTAGATVTATFAEDGEGTRVNVVTDLAITGKAAQFGRGNVLQDVSDKLLAQFVACLKSKVTAPAAEVAAEEAAAAETSAAAAEQPAAAPGSGEAAAGDAGARETSAAPAAAASPSSAGSSAPSAAPRPTATVTRPEPTEDALDLGSTVLPILLRTYGPKLAVGVVVLVLLRWLWGRRG